MEGHSILNKIIVMSNSEIVIQISSKSYPNVIFSSNLIFSSKIGWKNGAIWTWAQVAHYVYVDFGRHGVDRQCLERNSRGRKV